MLYTGDIPGRQLEIYMATESIKFDKKLLQAKLDKVRGAHLTTVGKPNHNPFLWLGKHVAPLQERLDKGEQTKELHDSIMSLTEIPEPIDPNWVPPKPEPGIIY